MKRLYSLDAARGVAALAVVFWHWQHFFAISGEWQAVWQRDWQPFYWLFKPLYLEGWAAVDLFFAFSGFVFFWLYRQAIHDGKIGAGKFALLRFSRLYPLHVLTLFAVLGLQMLFFNTTGSYFIFDAGDWGRFAANLGMVQQWLPPNTDQTFNGPAWTVSIEAGLYVVFFILCRLGFNGPKSAFVVALTGIALFHWNWFIARGLSGFFLGGLAYFAVEKIRARADARRISQILGVLALALWGLVVVEILYGPLHVAFAWLSGHISSQVGQLYADDSDDLFHLLYIFVVIPISVTALALHELVLGGRYEKYVYLGDISYSTYMLHFPLQITCALLALRFGLQPAFFMHGAVMIAFYAVLIGIGSLSYFFWEKPMQSLIRSFVAKPEQARAH